jgi:hypothetical protein
VPTLGDIVRRHGAEYLARHGPTVPSEHRRILALLGACRTGALGRVHWQCERCGRSHQTPRSCGNRHCPECQSSKNEHWLAEQSARRLEVPYFLLTFTLPAKLRRFARSHQRVAYAALFCAASRALEKLARDPRFLGAARLGFTAVLHTWGRQMTYHPHLHVVVPAGGTSEHGREWIAARPDFLVPVKALSRIFRAKFRAEMQRAGLLDEIDPTVWSEAFVTDSRAVGNGEATLRYLARYVFRVAISNARIVSLEAGRVRFRWKKSGGRRWRTMDLDALEFLRRFLQHVRPPGLQKVRHYGFLSSHSAVSLDEVRALVARANKASDERDAASLATAATAATDDQAATASAPTCPHCGGQLVLVEIVFHRVDFHDSG